MVGDQLAQIFIVGNDDNIQASGFRFTGEGANDVVCFKTREANERHAQSVADALNVWQLQNQIVRHSARVALCIVQTVGVGT